MKNIKFSKDILPHIVAIIVFSIIIFFLFKPIFLDNAALFQSDIQQYLGSAKSIIEFREKYGYEPLWSDMFSGMPAHLISVIWSIEPISFLKRLLSLWLPSPVNNIFLAFICYYIMLLAFGVRPLLAIAGAIAFGLSSYMIIGVIAGHNSRIGSIAYIPLVIAGIHLCYSRKLILGFAITTAGLSLHLNANHIQITYYLLLIALVYGVIQLIFAIKNNTFSHFYKSSLLLILSLIFATGTYCGQLWMSMEYVKYSNRGKSELSVTSATNTSKYSDKTYAFNYSIGLLEPITILVPDFYGGSGSNFLVQNENSHVYRALVNSADSDLANQLAYYTSSYWGEESPTPYYGGAIIVFLFVLGITLVDKKIFWWIIPLSCLSIIMCWGDNFKAFNYFLFDYLPGYNKFRSPTFSMIIILFGMPLLGMLALERIIEKTPDAFKKKLLISFLSTAGLCLLFLTFTNVFDFLNESELKLPSWFINSLTKDRKELFQNDLLRSFIFITLGLILIVLVTVKK